MKIKYLRQRENFEKGFTESLYAFLIDKYQLDSNIKWVSLFSFLKKDDRNVFVVNDVLNVIYPRYLAADKLAPFTQEFIHHPNVLRRFFQKMYVYWAVRFPFNALTSTFICIDHLPAEADSWIILPGNHSHRIIDLSECRGTVFIKKGFNSRFLKNDAGVRQTYNYLPSPKVFDLTRSWYSEQIITGLPLNRLGDVDLEFFAVNKANKAMSQLYHQTIRLECLIDYVNATVERITSIAFSFQCEKMIDVIEYVELLQRHLSQSSLENIETVVTHGDYQSANILLDGQDIWLIDWEYSARRTLYFDRFCYFFNTRSVFGLGSRINDFVSLLSGSERVFFSDLSTPLNASRVDYLYVYFIEEILLRILEVESIEIKNKSVSICPWVDEFKQVCI